MKLEKIKELVQKRRWRIRKKVKGTSERPRLSLYFSNKHIYAQCIDDESGKTLICLTSLSKEIRDKSLNANKEGATLLGNAFGQKIKAAGIDKIVFDRSGRRYHGCVKEFADAVRKLGIMF